jgi:hypothetical protein
MVKTLTPRSYAVTVGTTVTEVFPEPSREIAEVFIRNTSTGGQVISLGVGATAIANSGIVLNPGDVVSWSKDLGYTVPRDRFSAVSSAASGTLAVMYRLVDEG